MDIVKYPNNSGIFNLKRRYREFMIDLCVLCAQTPLGYVNYITIKEGDFLKALPYLDQKEIAKLKV